MQNLVQVPVDLVPVVMLQKLVGTSCVGFHFNFKMITRMFYIFYS